MYTKGVIVSLTLKRIARQNIKYTNANSRKNNYNLVHIVARDTIF